MSLLSIVAGYIDAVNPRVPVTLKISTGYTQSADYKQVPAYNTVTGVLAQIQALQYRDLAQADALNLNGSRRSIYLQGDVEAIVRVNSKGGDLIITPDGNTYLVAFVAENWNAPDGSNSGWVRCVCTLQNGQ